MSKVTKITGKDLPSGKKAFILSLDDDEKTVFTWPKWGTELPSVKIGDDVTDRLEDDDKGVGYKLKPLPRVAPQEKPAWIPKNDDVIMAQSVLHDMTRLVASGIIPIEDVLDTNLAEKWAGVVLKVERYIKTIKEGPGLPSGIKLPVKDPVCEVIVEDIDYSNKEVFQKAYDNLKSRLGWSVPILLKHLVDNKIMAEDSKTIVIAKRGEAIKVLERACKLEGK